MLIAGIVGRIDIFEIERSEAVNLNDGCSLSPCEMIHALRHPHETAWLNDLTFARVELVAHSSAERTHQDSHVFVGWMRMRGYLIAVGHLEPQRERNVCLHWVPSN